MLQSLTILLIFQLIGEALVEFADLPLPGPVTGMTLLFVALAVRGGIPGRSLGQGCTADGALPAGPPDQRPHAFVVSQAIEPETADAVAQSQPGQAFEQQPGQAAGLEIVDHGNRHFGHCATLGQPDITGHADQLALGAIAGNLESTQRAMVDAVECGRLSPIAADGARPTQ